MSLEYYFPNYFYILKNNNNSWIIFGEKSIMAWFWRIFDLLDKTLFNEYNSNLLAYGTHVLLATHKYTMTQIRLKTNIHIKWLHAWRAWAYLFLFITFLYVRVVLHSLCLEIVTPSFYVCRCIISNFNIFNY